MPSVATNGSACTTGHGCDTTTTVNGGSDNVIIDNKGVARKNHPLASHTIPQGPNCIPHPSQKVNEGSASVFVNGEPIARVGDSVDIGGQITSGESNVVAGG